eukprot:TRINITY_DN15561_c0_g1_i1.p1 TRINITY_DN15561_c0_g1~~TRINITY_DN15561_c0_g1_i1.p1  ORF type:complete len:219 (-),score=19.58 TRINITY_DN15561_c0_g1_i1:44-700(-)
MLREILFSLWWTLTTLALIQNLHYRWVEVKPNETRLIKIIITAWMLVLNLVVLIVVSVPGTTPTQRSFSLSSYLQQSGLLHLLPERETLRRVTYIHILNGWIFISLLAMKIFQQLTIDPKLIKFSIKTILLLQFVDKKYGSFIFLFVFLIFAFILDKKRKDKPSDGANLNTTWIYLLFSNLFILILILPFGNGLISEFKEIYTDFNNAIGWPNVTKHK